MTMTRNERIEKLTTGIHEKVEAYDWARDQAERRHISFVLSTTILEPEFRLLQELLPNLEDYFLPLRTLHDENQPMNEELHRFMEAFDAAVAAQ